MGASNFIHLQAYDSLGVYDQCSLSITGVLPNTFTELSVSQVTVQLNSFLQFTLISTTPIQSTDSLIIVLDPLFSLSSLVPSTVILGIGAFPLGVNGNTITISAISSGILISTILKFNLSVIGPPSTNQPASIRVSVQTSAGYFRDQQTLSYSASPGQLAATMTCLTYEIGYATSCTLQLTTASKIPNNGVIAILFSNIFNMLDTNSPCRLSGTGLNLLGTCITFGSNNTLLVTGLTPAGSSSQIQPQTLTVTFSLTIPSSIGSFTLSLQTLSPVWTIDQTTLSISSSPRKLLSPELAISSSSTITYSPTVYTLVFSLPLTLPLTYTIQCALPFDVQIGRTILISNAIMVNFVGGTLTMTSLSLTAGYSITIANLMTYQSRQPIPISVTISSNSNIYFKGSLTLTMTTAKQLDSITFIQSSSMVYSNNLGNIVASGLSNGDMILLTANYTGFYPSAQPDCTFLIAKCGNNGLITIVQAGNLDGVTSFVLNLFNPPYVGQSTLSLIVYDSQRAYEKQRGTLTLTTSIPNQMRAMLTQSNPYYLEPSVYAFSLSLTTPSATRLNILVPATYTITTVTCVLNCIVLSTTANSIVLSVSSSNIAVNVQVTNPDAFADWTFTSSSALGDMDYATVSPKLVCVAPCRSCSSNYSQCLTCYPWQSNNKLSNYNCLATCPNQYYPLLSGLYYVCTACNSFCLSCSNNPDNCSSCVSPFILFGQSCLQ